MTIHSIVRLMTLAAAAMTATAQMTNEAREAFLSTAKILQTKGLSMGVTNSQKAYMSDGGIEHDAHIQSIDEAKTRFEGANGSEINFRDTYKFNVAAYRLAKLLNLDMVPPSVERKVAGKSSAVTWWVDGAMMTELDRRKKKQEAPDRNAWNKQMNIVSVFDELIYNVYRNMGNLVITKEWNVWMIDHTRAFRLHKNCPKLANIKQIDRNLLDNLRMLTREMLKQQLNGYLRMPEIDAVLARRDAIVKYFESRVAQNGEATVLYEMARRQPTP
jgi:hypothetical protein